MATTKKDLLLAGWHEVWSEATGTFWAHPNYPTNCRFAEAAKALKEQGVDKHGFMKGKGWL